MAVYNSRVPTTAYVRISARMGRGTFAFILLSSCGRSLEYYLEKGNTLFAQGQYAEASLNYRKALQKDPKSGEAYYRVALSAIKQNQGSEAYQSLLQAVRLSPD